MLLLKEFVIICSIVATINASSQCFVCSSHKDRNCDYEKFDKSIASTKCMELIYDNESKSDGLEFIHNAYETPDHIRHSSNNKEVMDFTCVKAVLQHVNATKGEEIVRTCVQYRADIKSACKFLLGYKDWYTVKKCQECNDNDCNAADSMTHSLILLVFTLFLLHKCCF